MLFVPPMIDPRPPTKDAAAATILVADDNEATRSALRKLLAAEGYHVIEAGDGDTTLEILVDALEGGAGLPDFLLLDFSMPGFSGIGVLRALRRVARIPPTVLITGFPDPSVDALALGLGVIRVLRKPVDADELLAVILEGMKRRYSPAT